MVPMVKRRLGRGSRASQMAVNCAGVNSDRHNFYSALLCPPPRVAPADRVRSPPAQPAPGGTLSLLVCVSAALRGPATDARGDYSRPVCRRSTTCQTALCSSRMTVPCQSAGTKRIILSWSTCRTSMRSSRNSRRTNCLHRRRDHRAASRKESPLNRLSSMNRASLSRERSIGTVSTRLTNIAQVSGHPAPPARSRTKVQYTTSWCAARWRSTCSVFTFGPASAG